MKTEKKPLGYWNVYENCYNEAKKYSTLNDFVTCSTSAYNKARKHGWMKDYTWLRRLDRKTGMWWKNGHGKAVVQFSMEGEYIAEHESAADAARAIGKSTGEYCNMNILSCCKNKFNSAYGFKWVFKTDVDMAEELFKERERKLRCVKEKSGGYTDKEILEEASKYETIKDFRDGSYNYYSAAVRKGITNKLPLKRSKNPYADAYCVVYAYFFKETHSAYVGVTDNMQRRNRQHRKEHEKERHNSAVFKHARNNGLVIPDPVILEQGLGPIEALDKEDMWKKRYKAEGWNILNIAKTGVNSGSMGNLVHRLSKKKVLNKAREYKTLKEFSIKNKSYYAYALSHNFLNELCFLEREHHKPYTYEDCFYGALDCSTIDEFKRKSSKMYYKSREMGWSNEYFWLRRKREVGVALSKVFTSFEDWEIEAFGTIKDASLFVGFNKKAIYGFVSRKATELGYEASRL